MKAFLLAIILVLFNSPCFSQKRNIKKPIILKLIEKPAELKAGQTHTFVFDVQNTSNNSLTLSSLCADEVNLFWLNAKGLEMGTGVGCGGSVIIVSDSYDPATKKITGTSRLYPYDESNFFTLLPNQSKRFETEIEVPTDLKAKFVNVRISFESKYDGRIWGIKAWKGGANLIILEMPIVK